MMKRVLFAVLAFSLLSSTAHAALLAEYKFDSDATDTANGYHGMLGGGASISGGALVLNGGGYMDLPSAFSAVNPFDGSGDFTIEMDFASPTGGLLISSARDDTPDNHAMAVYLGAWEGEAEAIYDNFWVGAAGAGGETGSNNPADGAWHSLRVIYDTDGSLLSEEWVESPEAEWDWDNWGEPMDEWDEDGEIWFGALIELPEDEWEVVPLIEVSLLDGQDWNWEGDFNPEIPDVQLDTVSLGRSLNTEFPYEELADPAEWVLSVDNVRIYSHVVPEPATVMLLGLGGLGLLRRRRRG
jgi:hypothetical protein